MAVIDDAIVEMKLENSHFKRGVDTTLSALSSLKNALQLKGATQGLDGITTAANKVKLDGMTSGIENVKSKFQALGVAAGVVLAGIVQKAASSGIQFAKAFTVKPMLDGLKEYEVGLNSVQTIMSNTAAKGTTMKDVNAALAELNTYSDKTIYNFGEMARNIGTFTAAGVELDTATGAIKGIANLAAVSGSNSQQASTAMYQLSQAMATGTVKLMDWNSVVNAGMGGEVFQKALKDTARVSGVAIDDIIEKNGSFRDSLQEGWLTSDILTDTLAKFTGDMSEADLKNAGYTAKEIEEIQKMATTAVDAATKVKTFTQLLDTLGEAAGSGWAQSWQIMIGDFEEAKELWTGVSDVLGGMIGKSAEARNKMLSDWKEMGGRTAIINSIGNAFKALMGVLGPIGKAFRDIFPPMTGERLAQLSKQLENFTRALIPSESTMDKIGRTAKGFFAVLDIGLHILKMVGSVMLRVVGALFSGSGGFLDVTASLGDFLVSVRDAIKNGEGLTRFFEKIGDVLVAVVRGIKNFVGALLGGFSNLDLGGAEKALDGVGKRLSPLQKLGQAVGRVFKTLAENMGGVWKVARKVGTILGDMFGDLGQQIMSGLSNMDFSLVLDTINTGLFAVIGLSIKKFIDTLTGQAGGIGDKLGFMDRINGAIDGVTSTLSTMQATLKSGTLVAIAVALALMTASLIGLSMIDSARLGKALLALSAMMGQLVVAMTLLNGITITGGLVKLTALGIGMVLMSIAITILATAVKKLADLEWQGLAKGLAGVVVLILALSGAAKLMAGNAGGMIAAGAGLILLATAIRILVSAVEDFAAMSWEELAKGLSGVAALLLALGLFTKFSNVEKMGVLAGAGLILLGVGIRILATAVEQFAGLSWEEIAKGLVSVGALLGMIAIFAATSGNGVMLIGTAAGLTIIAAAMKILAGVMGQFGGMSWEEIAKGLVAMAGALAIIAGAMALMSSALLGAAALIVVAQALKMLAPVLILFGSLGWMNIAQGLTMLAGSLIIIAGAMVLMTTALAGAAALIVVAGALALMGPVLVALSGLSWGEIAAGLTMLAGVFVILGVAGLLLTPLVPTLIGLGIAIGLLGLGVALAGAGVFLFAAGLTALAAAGAVASAAFVAMVGAILSVLPMIISSIAQTLVGIANAIATAAPAIVNAITVVILALLKAVIRLTPQILKAFETILRGVLGVINRNAGPIVTTFMRVLDLLLRAAVAAVPRITNAGLQIITGFLKALSSNVNKIVPIAADLIVKFINAVSNQLPRIIQSGVNLIVKFVNGVANAIRSNTSQMNAAGRNLASAVVSGMVSGISGGIGAIAGAARRVAQSALNAAKNLLGINSPSKEFMKIGRWSSEGMALGIDKYSTVVADSARGVGLDAIFAMKKSISGLSAALEGEMDATPTITPVLDLSEVAAGVKKLDPMLGARQLEIDASYSRASAISKQRSQAEEQTVVVAPPSVSEAPVTFVQNNNSPKALSSVEIYRQTKNQLSVLKGGTN